MGAAKSAAEEGIENVPHIKAAHAAKAAGSSARSIGGVYPRMAELIVFGAFILIGQHLIRLVHLFEFGFRFLITRIQVRVILLCQLAVCFFQFIVRASFLNAQDFIIISFLSQTYHPSFSVFDRKGCPKDGLFVSAAAFGFEKDTRYF